MGKPGSESGTYLGMIEHNATAISNALRWKINPLLKSII
jgi:hypothetical protein